MSDIQDEDGRCLSGPRSRATPHAPDGHSASIANATPGPWEIKEDPDEESAVGYIVGWSADEDRNVDSPWYIAKIYDGIGENGDEEANARLIASAPDLYEALGGLLMATQDFGADQGNPYIEAARAALARARGEE